MRVVGNTERASQFSSVVRHSEPKQWWTNKSTNQANESSERGSNGCYKCVKWSPQRKAGAAPTNAEKSQLHKTASSESDQAYWLTTVLVLNWPNVHTRTERTERKEHEWVYTLLLYMCIYSVRQPETLGQSNRLANNAALSTTPTEAADKAQPTTTEISRKLHNPKLNLPNTQTTDYERSGTATGLPVQFPLEATETNLATPASFLLLLWSVCTKK